MRIKLIIAAVSVFLVVWLNWPKSPDANASYYPKTAEVSEETQRDITQIMKVIEKWCAEKRYDRLEKEAFALSHAEKLLAEDAHGFDPVERSLGLLKDVSDQLEWHIRH